MDSKSGRQLNNVKGILEEYSQVVVYYVDGGCFNEYQNLAALELTTHRPIYYGAGFIYSADQLINMM